MDKVSYNKISQSRQEALLIAENLEKLYDTFLQDPFNPGEYLTLLNWLISIEGNQTEASQEVSALIDSTKDQITLLTETPETDLSRPSAKRMLRKHLTTDKLKNISTFTQTINPETNTNQDFTLGILQEIHEEFSNTSHTETTRQFIASVLSAIVDPSKELTEKDKPLSHQNIFNLTMIEYLYSIQDSPTTRIVLDSSIQTSIAWILDPSKFQCAKLEFDSFVSQTLDGHEPYKPEKTTQEKPEELTDLYELSEISSPTNRIDPISLLLETSEPQPEPSTDSFVETINETPPQINFHSEPTRVGQIEEIQVNNDFKAPNSENFIPKSKKQPKNKRQAVHDLFDSEI